MAVFMSICCQGNTPVPPPPPSPSLITVYIIWNHKLIVKTKKNQLVPLYQPAPLAQLLSHSQASSLSGGNNLPAETVGSVFERWVWLFYLFPVFFFLSLFCKERSACLGENGDIFDSRLDPEKKKRTCVTNCWPGRGYRFQNPRDQNVAR